MEIKPTSTKLDFRTFEQDILPGLASLDGGDLKVDLSGVTFFDLTGIVPLVAIIDSLAAKGVWSDVQLPRNQQLAKYMDTAGWTDAIMGRPCDGQHGETFTKLRSFRSGEECTESVTEAMDILARVSEFPEGVLRGIKWLMDEITDNVLVHAGPVPGWIQLVSRPKRDEVHIVVADCGYSIVKTIRKAFDHLEDDRSALASAIERGTTRDTSVGQGNDLAGSLRIARELKGYVNILSGTACLRQNPVGELEIHSTPQFPGSVITLTVSSAAEIDVSEALWGSEDGYEPARPFEHSHIEYEGIVFRLSVESSGFGNRASGEALVNKLRNISEGSPDERVIIDFEGIDLASASFLDEFIAKLIRREGITSFFGRYSFRNMDELVKRTLDQVIAQRLASDR